jgi:uridine kinase
MRSLIHTIIQKSQVKSPYVVGISGIDGSGKGYVASKVYADLIAEGLSCALVGIDGWLQPPSQRFSQQSPAQHFYDKGFRFDEMQQQLYDPLCRFGRVDVVVKHANPTDSEEMVEYHYQIDHPDVIIFEGIFLFQDRFTFDYSVWVECSYETALERALNRNQEGVSDERIKQDYRTIYFAAQKIHLETDHPRDRCDFIYLNDDRQKGVWP